MSTTTIGELVTAGVLEFGDGYRTKRSELSDHGFRIIRVADIKDGRIVLQSPDFVGLDRLRSIGNKAGQTGDILLTTKGTVGRVAVYGGSSESVVYSPQICYFRVRSNDVIAVEYLRYWFESSEFTFQASYRKSNTDMADYINLADVRSMRIRIPDLGSQKRVVDILGALDDKIAANRKLAATADQLAVALVKTRELDTDGIELADVASVTMGSSPPGATYNEDGTGMVFYQGNRDFGFRSPSNRVWTVDPKRTAGVGDTLISVRAPVGHLNIASEETCIGRGLAALRSTVGTPSLLYYRLKAANGLWESYESGGTVFGSINGKELNALKIPQLAGNEKGLEEQVAALDEAIASAEAEVVVISSIRNALLPRLMSGDLRVRDAEKEFESVL